MESIFLKILNMSITASYLVLAVVLLRLVLKKAPKAVSVAMWALVGLRLILPFSFESALSLIPSAQTVPPDIALSPTPMIQSGIPILNDALNPVISQSFAPDPAASANPLQILISVAAILWLLGMAVMAIYAFVSWLRVRRTVRESIPLTENIYLCDRVPTPFILGLFRPRIYLPSATEAGQIPYILAHEKAHLQRKDHLWKPIGFAILALHWFNPLVWVAYILLCRDIETACDEKVIKKLGADSKKPYSQALISCSVPRRAIAACPLAFGEVNVKGRIKSVLNYKKPAFWVVLVAVLLCVGLAIGFLTDPKEDAPDITGSEPSNMACVDEVPVLMGDTEEFSLVFGGNYSLHHTLTVSQLHPVWCLTVNNIGPDTVKVEIQGTVYPVAPDSTAYIYATEDWAPGDYPVSFTSTQPMEGNVRCSLHMSHGFSSAGTVIGGADGPGSILIEQTPMPGDFLRRHYPQYFGLPTDDGLHVYIWQFAQFHYACVLLAGEGQYTEMEMLAMDPVSIPQMRKILDSYDIRQKDVTLHPFNHPASSYYYEIDDAYRKNLETLFWQPTVIHGSQNYGIEMEITPVDDLVFDLTLTRIGKNSILPGTARTWEVCELSIWYADTWYPIDEYLRDICKRTDVPERLPWSMELVPFSQAEPFTQRVDLGAVYGDLPAGQYLIRKQTPFYPDGQDVILCYCGAEFTIEE